MATKTQGPIVAALKAEKATFKPMWIRNMIKVHGDKALLLEMAARPDVAEIIYEYPATPDVVGHGTVDRQRRRPTPSSGTSPASARLTCGRWASPAPAPSSATWTPACSGITRR